MGGGGGEGERVKARPRIPPEKDQRDRGPPPEAINFHVKAVSSPLAIAQRLVHRAIALSTTAVIHMQPTMDL